MSRRQVDEIFRHPRPPRRPAPRISPLSVDVAVVTIAVVGMIGIAWSVFQVRGAAQDPPLIEGTVVQGQADQGPTRWANPAVPVLTLDPPTAPCTEDRLGRRIVDEHGAMWACSQWYTMTGDPLDRFGWIQESWRVGSK